MDDVPNAFIELCVPELTERLSINADLGSNSTNDCSGSADTDVLITG